MRANLLNMLTLLNVPTKPEYKTRLSYLVCEPDCKRGCKPLVLGQNTLTTWRLSKCFQRFQILPCDPIEQLRIIGTELAGRTVARR